MANRNYKDLAEQIEPIYFAFLEFHGVNLDTDNDGQIIGYTTLRKSNKTRIAEFFRQQFQCEYDNDGNMVIYTGIYE